MNHKRNEWDSVLTKSVGNENKKYSPEVIEKLKQLKEAEEKLDKLEF